MFFLKLIITKLLGDITTTQPEWVFTPINEKPPQLQ